MNIKDNDSTTVLIKIMDDGKKMCLTEVKKEYDTYPEVKSEGACTEAEFPFIKCENLLDKSVIKEECDPEVADPLQLPVPGSHPAQEDVDESGKLPHLCSICHTGDESHSRVCSKCLPRGGSFCDTTFVNEHTGELPFLCVVCSKSFPCEGNLKAHRCTVNGEGPYSCPFCKKLFDYLSELKGHGCGNSGAGPFPCKLCKKPFFDLSELTKHKCTSSSVLFRTRKQSFCIVSELQTLRSSDGPFTCQFCKKSFHYIRRLEKHSCSRGGEGPFKCKLCKEAFHYLSQLKKHTCPLSEEGPFTCNFCKQSFHYLSQMRGHTCTKTVDSLHLCTCCKISFHDANELKSHQNIICSVCGVVFCNINALVGHKISHHIPCVSKKMVITSSEWKRHFQ